MFFGLEQILNRRERGERPQSTQRDSGILRFYFYFIFFGTNLKLAESPRERLRRNGEKFWNRWFSFLITIPFPLPFRGGARVL